MTELEALKQRHSVRAYTKQKIEGEKVQKLEELINEVNETGDLHIQFVENADKAFNRILSRVMGLSSAPSVIACIGKDDDTLDKRIGYYGQKIVLLAQQLGLNTCWAGTFNKNNVNAEIADGERLSIVIAIGYGENDGKPRRTKTAEKVSNCTQNSPEWFKNGVQTALLAPTAINQQKFFITLEDDGNVTFKDLGGVFSKVDIGIVRYNFEVGASADQKS